MNFSIVLHVTALAFAISACSSNSQPVQTSNSTEISKPGPKAPERNCITRFANTKYCLSEMEPQHVLTREAYRQFEPEIARITNGDFKLTAGYNLVPLPREAIYDAENQPDNIAERTNNPAFVRMQIRLLSEIFEKGPDDKTRLQNFKALHAGLREILLNRLRLGSILTDARPAA